MVSEDYNLYKYCRQEAIAEAVKIAIYNATGNTLEVTVSAPSVATVCIPLSPDVFLLLQYFFN